MNVPVFKQVYILRMIGLQAYRPTVELTCTSVPKKPNRKRMEWQHDKIKLGGITQLERADKYKNEV
jgi:hypothetical protein